MHMPEALSELRLRVERGSLIFFTTLLQYGFRLEASSGMALGDFLSACPGFSPAYLHETVQTIFMDGTAIDDLATPLTGSHRVVALSAAMPGLAGAIFRRNGPHATLRTATATAEVSEDRGHKVSVTVKLFNQIARERGSQLLQDGVVMESRAVRAFLRGRPELVARTVTATLDGLVVAPATLTAQLGQMAQPAEGVRFLVREG